MANIIASVTDDFRVYLPQYLGRLLGNSEGTSVPGKWNPVFRGFKIGEGGWISSPGGPVRRQPVANLRCENNQIQDLDIIVDGTRTVSPWGRYTDPNRRGSFYKSLTNADFSQDPVRQNALRIKCLLDFSEFNDNGSGLAPNLWEIGIFAEHPIYPPSHPPSPPPAGGLNPGQYDSALLMVAYGTFPMEIKDSSKQIEHYVILID